LPLLIPIFLEVPSNFRCNLTITHPVNCFNTSGSLSQSLANGIKAGLDKMIPVHTPAHQPGNFQKVLITPNQILFFNFWPLSPYPGSPCNSIPIHQLFRLLIFWMEEELPADNVSYELALGIL